LVIVTDRVVHFASIASSVAISNAMDGSLGGLHDCLAADEGHVRDFRGGTSDGEQSGREGIRDRPEEKVRDEHGGFFA
jgi:hypothetical protein